MGESKFWRCFLLIYPSKLQGKIAPPPSKSHTHRALLFAMLAKGTSKIHNPLFSPDTEAMVTAIEAFGAKVTIENSSYKVEGGFLQPKETIDAKNSGIVYRFCTALAALFPKKIAITGDHSIQTRRPIRPLHEAIHQLGHPLQPGTCFLDGTDSQPISALLLATSLLDGETTIEVKNPGELPWIELSLYWLRKMGAEIEHEDFRLYRVKGGLKPDPFSYTVPADFSSAAFPLAASFVTQSSIEILNLDFSDPQGDKILFSHVEKMQDGGLSIDCNSCIDALPILAVLGCYAKGTTHLYNGAIARKKECDRIACIAKELRKMGAKIQEKEDGLIIEQSPLHGATLESHNDHRIALSLAIAALGASSPSTIANAGCIAKTYPTFVQDFQKIGAHIERDPVRV